MNKDIKKDIKFFPIICILAIVPLIVRLHLIHLEPEVSRCWTSDTAMDLYSFSKTIAIMILSTLIIIISFLNFRKNDLKMDKLSKMIYICVGSYVLLLVMSSIFASSKALAFWGAPERCEGLIIHICYMVIFLYTYLIIKDVSDFKYIKYATIFLGGVLLIIGFFQFIGKDLLTNDFFAKIIVPKEYQNEIKPVDTYGIIYLTMMHYNYVGSYAAMIIPLFFVIAFSKYENKSLRICFAVLALGTTILLSKSNSQAGLVGLSVAVLLGVIIFSKFIFRNKKIAFSAIIGCLVLIILVNITTNGLLLHNVVDVVEDAKKIVVKDNGYVHDPTYGLPIYDVKTNSNIAIVETKFGELKLYFNDDATISIKDKDNKDVIYEYNEKERNYTLPNPYNEIMVLKSDNSNDSYSQIALYHGKTMYYLLEWVKGEGVFLVDAYLNRYETEIAPHIGFEGSEKVGSMRGYIWSRTFPMILKKPILGYGPEHFLISFPQYDMAAKTYAYDTPFMIIDKPHNLYLLYAINSGIISLILMLILWGTYILDSIKLYGFRKNYFKSDYYGIACLVAIVGYLGAGFFNDSVPSVAPIFWVILGTGYALNGINKQLVNVETKNQNK